MAQLSLSGPCALSSGTYRLVVGADIAAPDGKGLDQDAEASSAQSYVARFTVNNEAACPAKTCRRPQDCLTDDVSLVFACVIDGTSGLSSRGTCVPLPERCTAERDCPAGYTCGASASCELAHCSSGAMDGDETDQDCGGSCQPCQRGQRCIEDEDCTSSDVCSDDDTCASAANCSDGVKNGGESDVDCGGSCDPCQRGQSCGSGQDCVAPDICSVDDTCALPASCNNGSQDADETDVDCGGSCDPCALGRRCRQDKDCQSSAFCSSTSSSGVCAVANS